MAATVIGRVGWKGEIDKDGHRTYTVEWLVKAAAADGPQVVFTASGLPAVGAAWAYGNDSDAWAFCWPDWSASPVITPEKGLWWVVEQTFTTKPLKRCQTNSIENPLNEPDRISGSFTKFTREATVDKDGNPIKSSSHEQVRGPQVERDGNRPNVRIEMNVSSNPLSTFAPMVDTVNDATLWGLSARMVKLSNVSWERKLYGTCTYYYTVTYEFDIDYETFDRTLMDEGTKVLCAGGDSSNPQHFKQYKDINGENSRVILNGSGAAWDGTGSPGTISAQFYGESNFLLLGIPTSL